MNLLDREGPRLITIILFSLYLNQGTKVDESATFQSPFTRASAFITHISNLSTSIHCYRGTRQVTPAWVDEDPSTGRSVHSVIRLTVFLDGFTELCKISGDCSNVPKVLKTGPNGEKYYRQGYDVVISFGMTELQAHLEWNEKVSSGS